ncbi:hypothetical protein OSB04_015910 [Centaurea solstitialis]|uniref:TIR domain-containing protein n=1 Tax=Centaurea solstitialis TaxID=347529 RepID=A0AA38SZX5_9ASTR|nr:hypothetical protein OSB04_015910 [Centaurea solstitialis]
MNNNNGENVELGAKTTIPPVKCKLLATNHKDRINYMLSIGMDPSFIPSMASSSTSSIHKSNFKYDVFLSFRGEDTCTNFVDHLYHALKQENIETYKDDKNLERGKKISKELIQAIEDSRFHVIVFSKNYASSSWCLDELVKIMECQNMKTGQIVYPIFYDVEPIQVRKQSGEFGKAFSKHENDEFAENWRKALVKATSFSGRDLSTTANGHEVDFIKLVVNDISMKLPVVFADENLVGMRTRVNDVISSLKAAPNEVCMIGIWGMGGGGKTTLARAVFDQICSQFEGSSFVENVRESSTNPLLGLKSLQQQVLRDVFKRQDIFINGVLEGKKEMKKKMHRIKVLVVLDDIDHIDQLKALAGECNWFKKGSVIIITTRDEQVLRSHNVEPIQVNLLSNEEALSLFCMNAFRTEVAVQGYVELSREVVSYAAGLPLTITVLGSHLCGRSTRGWKGVLESLKRMPSKEVVDILELSYTRLEDNIKEIFLDVACMGFNNSIDDVVYVLESCGHFEARCGLDVLKEKSLIICGLDFLVVNWIFDDVSQYFPNALRYISWTCYPFWCLPKTFQANNLVELVMRYSRMIQLWEHMDKKVLGKLRFLDLSHSTLMTLDLRLTPNLEVLSLERCKSLVELHMPDECLKLKSVDLNFTRLKNFDLRLTPNLEMLNLERCYHLVELHMPPGCPKLKSLCLNHSKLRTLNLGLTPNLEKLSLENCYDLVELDMHVGCLNLTSLNLTCSKLRTLNLGPTLNLEMLLLRGCRDLIELHMPVRCLNLRSFILTYSKVRTLDLEPCPNLKELCIIECNDLVELHMPVACPKIISIDVSCSKLRTFDLRLTPNLETFSLRGCDNLVEFHMPVGCLELRSLNLGYSKSTMTLDLGLTPNLEKLTCHDLVELYMPIGCLKLKSLDLGCSKLMTLDLGLTPNLEELTCHDLVELHMPHECLELKSLNLSASELRSLDLGMLPNLSTLTLERCHDLVELHMPVGSLNLVNLKLTYSKLRTLDLGLTPNLTSLSVEGCHDLVELHIPPGGCPKLKFLNLSGSKLRTLDFGLTPNLERLNFEGCDDLVEFHMLVGCLRLRSLNLSHSNLTTFDLGLTPNLYWLELKECVNLVELRAPVGCLGKLVSLDLSGCSNFTSHFLEKEFESVEEVDSWVDFPLIMESLDICPLPSDDNLLKFRFTCFYKDPFFSMIGNLEKLLYIGLCARTNLRTFCQNLSGFRRLSNPDQLQCLEELILSSTEIKHFPGCIFMLKHLKSLELKSCWLLEKLPEDLGRLECLEKLTLSDCMSLREIPNGISKMRRLEYLGLPHCISVEVLPQDLGYLECLKELNIEGTCIRHLPSSIFSLKGLRIVRCRWLLELCGFTSKIQTAEYETFCYI